jgi:hypothetical protein
MHAGPATAATHTGSPLTVMNARQPSLRASPQPLPSPHSRALGKNIPSRNLRAAWASTPSTTSAAALGQWMMEKAASLCRQGLTIVQFSAQLERFTWDRGARRVVFLCSPC